MCRCCRRRAIAMGLGVLASRLVEPTAGLAKDGAGAEAQRQRFIAAAERMRLDAVRAGDQSYGAVVVLKGEIVGWGPSRVVTSRDPNYHAERVAIWDAQERRGTKDLSGALLYSTSRACSLCEAAAAVARVSRMYWGPKGVDAGTPRG